MYQWRRRRHLPAAAQGYHSLEPEGVSFTMWDDFGLFSCWPHGLQRVRTVVASDWRAAAVFLVLHCESTAGTDMLAQDVAVMPGGRGAAFGGCFLSPLMVGHVVQHLRECRAHAVILEPDIQAYWFPVLGHATTRSVEVASEGASVFFPRGLAPTRAPYATGVTLVGQCAR